MIEMKKAPFIHLFSCSTGFYVYDVNTDTILKVEEETYRGLQKNEENVEIKKLKRHGYLKNTHVEITEHPATQLLEEFYENKLNSIVLQVTQKCNLRCDYCVYSGKYNMRMHDNKNMDFNLAKLGIDYIYSHSKESPEFRIGFYGGEPLLEFELIKKCVEYIEIKKGGRKVKYLITTNATLLNKDIIDFLVKYKFILTISFDGPKEIHDRHRRFADGNRGSYDLVMKNARYIKDNYYEYFKENVSFNTVLNSQTGCDCIGTYIKGEDLFKDAVFTTGLVTDVGIKEKTKMSKEFLEEYNYEYFKLLMAKLGRVQEENVSIIPREEFEHLKIMRGEKKQVGVTELPKKWHHGGPCIPGERSLFLNVDGNFYPCERVCENAQITKIGNIEEGIDIEKAKKILNIEKCTEKECKQCWAYQYCNFCIRYAETDEDNLRKNILERCSDMRKTVERIFKDYCVMRELGYDFETECLKKE